MKNLKPSTELKSLAADCLALSADDVAKLLNISRRHLATLDCEGKIPRPIRLGRSVRWPAAEISDWLEAGAPNRSDWEASRNAKSVKGGSDDE